MYLQKIYPTFDSVLTHQHYDVFSLIMKYIEEYFNDDQKIKTFDYLNDLNLPKSFRSRMNKTKVCYMFVKKKRNEWYLKIQIRWEVN